MMMCTCAQEDQRMNQKHYYMYVAKSSTIHAHVFVCKISRVQTKYNKTDQDHILILTQ